ncbi:MAG: hypothetical protein JWN14_265 [Chthonomonadales bacterium]|nr:hypothetical protein [Chthonomonadales bacterium]
MTRSEQGSLFSPGEGYEEFVRDLKTRIHTAQVRAALAVNKELIQLYWDIGSDLVQIQQSKAWGESFFVNLARDIQSAFPGIEGFSRRNLYRMRAFYLGYSQDQNTIVPQAVAQIPWGHNAVLLEKVKDRTERLWYAQQCTEYGWSRSILEMQIERGLYRRQGQATSNFERTLPPPQSDLAQQILKDPYNFDFLGLTEQAHEREIERGLIEHIRDFLLELGVGFAFVGSQYHMEIGDQDFYIDLLFYHLRLRCYVVIELKAVAFQPEFAGKLNFYLCRRRSVASP